MTRKRNPSKRTRRPKAKGKLVKEQGTWVYSGGGIARYSIPRLIDRMRANRDRRVMGLE